MTDLDPSTAPAETPPPVPSQALLHYHGAIARVAASGRLRAQDAIYSDKGVKLIERGARVDGKLYARLARVTLRGSLDEQLAVDDMVTVQSVEQLALQLCQDDTLAYLLAHALGPGASARLAAPLRAMLLPHPLAFRLTVMREQHHSLYVHSVRMMLVALYLGVKSGWNERECVHLAAAGLLHDIGVLDLDPVWHDPNNRITGAGRAQLMAHPVSAMQAIQAQGVYPRTVEQAVLEHHESLDGSGYPHGLAGEQISPMGQILLLAEVVAAFFEKYAGQAAAQRLALTLKLNHRKFPAALAAHLLPVLEIRAVQAPVEVAQGDVERAIAQLEQAFAQWQQCAAALPPEALQPPSEQPCAFVEQQLAALQKTLFEAGTHPQQLADALPLLQGDAQSLAELALLGREALWQLQSIVNATHSRWPQLPDSPGPCAAAVLRWRQACGQHPAPDAPAPAA
jgi:HD-GYP domain-containing protein (c-di-GMP phosphodiesterase class II)